MKNPKFGFASLLAVIGISIVFGMLLGGRLNAPQVTFAAPTGGVVRLVPAVTGAGTTSFADIVERAWISPGKRERQREKKRNRDLPRSGSFAVSSGIRSRTILGDRPDTRESARGRDSLSPRTVIC
jgi:hypothetical protein